jgi:hypothetical protein
VFRRRPARADRGTGAEPPGIARELERRGFLVRSVHRQFVLPIALHKAIGSRRFTNLSRELGDRLGLLRLFGTPVTVVAERCRRS